MMGNQVLAQMLGDLISRCSLITLMYQSASAAAHSHERARPDRQTLGAKDEERAVQLMQAHLLRVEESLTFDRQAPVNDLSLALS